MPIYTVCSIDPEHYNELFVSLPFSNSQKVVSITVMSMCTLFNVELLNPNDYIIVESEGTKYKLVGHSRTRLSLDELPAYLEFLFENASAVGFKVELTQSNLLRFMHNMPFKILEMTYNFRIATGFYYPQALPIESVYDVEGGTFEIMPQAVALVSSTPILYILSNTGGQCYRMSMNENNVQNGTIGMIVYNSFMAGMPAIAQQGDIVSQCLSSELSSISIVLVDANFVPIKLLTPLYCTINVTEIADSPY
jgi:hypothetical protein